MNDYFFFDCLQYISVNFRGLNLVFIIGAFLGFFLLEKSGLIFKRAVATLAA